MTNIIFKDDENPEKCEVGSTVTIQITNGKENHQTKEYLVDAVTTIGHVTWVDMTEKDKKS